MHDDDGAPPCSGLTDLFFSYGEKQQAEAAAICDALCGDDRQAACLAKALQLGANTDADGVWGGTTPRQRRGLIKSQAAR